MRLTTIFFLICFAARSAGQAPSDSIFERHAARFYAAKGMARFALLDTIFPAMSFASFERTADLLKEALPMLEKADISPAERAQQQSKTCRRIGINYKSLSRGEEAIRWMQQAHAYGARLDSLTGRPNKERGWALTSLGSLAASSLRSTANFDKAAEYFRQAEGIFQACGDTAGLIYNYDMLSGAAYEFHRADLAVQSGRAGLALARVKKPRIVPEFLERIGQSFLLTEQPDSALWYFDQIGTAYEGPDRLAYKAKLCFLRGEAWGQKKDWQRAIECCQNMEAIGKQMDLPASMYGPMYSLYASACYHSGRYKEAYEFMERHKILNDSVMTTANDAKVAELREQFDAAQKENQIALLAAENKAKAFQQWLLVLLLVVGAAGGWWFWRALVRKQRARETELLIENSALQARFDRLLALHFDDATATARTDDPDDSFLLQLFDLLEENLANEEFNVEDLPQKMSISRTQFFKKIKILTGKTPAELLRAMRMQKARRLLHEGAATVSEAAAATGFGSLGSFSRAFKSFFGETPSTAKRGTEQAEV